jgi:hypothetical protein
MSAVAAALVLQVTIGGSDGGPRPPSGGDAAGAVTDGSWQRVRRPARHPGGFQGLVPVRVGHKVVVVAGVDYDQASVKGVIIDTSTGRSSLAARSRLRWRFGHSAVAAGKKVILWGGCCGTAGRGSRAAGAVYDVGRDRWSALGPGPLGNRHFHTAVWTGEEMIVWGGWAGHLRPTQLRADGAAYNRGADAWRMLAPAPLSPRRSHVAVWTGEEMIVWGGSKPLPRERERLLVDGAAYDPERNEWRRIAATRLLGGRAVLPAGLEPDLDAEWTGEEMTIWSRYGGASYDPESDRWKRIPAPPPEIRQVVGGQTVWSGEELIVWGADGDNGSNVQEGAAFDPSARRWRALPAAPIRGRDRHAAIRAPQGMLVWGGCCRRGTRFYADGAIALTRTGWAAWPPASARHPVNR